MFRIVHRCLQNYIFCKPVLDSFFFFSKKKTNMSHFTYIIEISKRPTVKKWFLVIAANRSIYGFKPVIINHEYQSSQYTLKVNMKRYDTYLSIPSKELSKQLYFYFYQNNKLKSWKRISMIRLNNTPTGIILEFHKNFTLKLIPKSTSTINVLYSTLLHKPSISKNRGELLINKYANEIDKKMKRLFEAGSTKPIIYYDLNPFKAKPIISSLLIDKESSNELFWLHLLTITKELYALHEVKWNPEVSWVLMFSMKNALVDTYILEDKKDIYLESWFCRCSDCDEAIMIYTLVRLFLKCTFENEELGEYQLFLSENYELFLTNVIVHLKNKEDIWHWICTLIPKDYFYSHNISSRTKVTKKGLPILIMEPTELDHPKVGDEDVDIDNPVMKSDRRIHTIRLDSSFYQEIVSLYTHSFLDKKRIHAFYCSMIKPKDKIYHRIPFKDFIQQNSNVLFERFPLLSLEFIKFAKMCAESRIPVPDFKINEYGSHKRIFKTTEDVDLKIRTVENSINEIKRDGVDSNDFVIFSLDDLLKPVIFNLLKQRRVIGFERKEVIYQNYFYIIHLRT